MTKPIKPDKPKGKPDTHGKPEKPGGGHGKPETKPGGKPDKPKGKPASRPNGRVLAAAYDPDRLNLKAQGRATWFDVLDTASVTVDGAAAEFADVVIGMHVKASADAMGKLVSIDAESEEEEGKDDEGGDDKPVA